MLTSLSLSKTRTPYWYPLPLRARMSASCRFSRLMILSYRLLSLFIPLLFWLMFPVTVPMRHLKWLFFAKRQGLRSEKRKQLLRTAGRIRIRDIVVRIVELEAGTKPLGPRTTHYFILESPSCRDTSR